MEERQREALEAAALRAADFEAEARALRELKYGLDARVSELSHKLGAAEGSNRCVYVCVGGEGSGVSDLPAS